MLLQMVLFVLLVSVPMEARAGGAQGNMASEQGGPRIYDVNLNLAEYANQRVPRYAKLEITFQVDTQAVNLQMPYDAQPPAGLAPGLGVTVDALFTPDDWQTVYRQPAFYYQVFTEAVRDGREWYYPTDTFVWKVRFAPPQTGRWQVRLSAQDASGQSESEVFGFEVAASDSKGFVRPSGRDPRYFEWEDGTYFPALGYNMNWDHVSWENPVLGNQENFQKMGQNGVQLVRMWLSQWSVYGSSWNPWNSIIPEQHGQYIPVSRLTGERAYPGSDVSMQIDAYNPCMFVGFMKPNPAVKPDTTYRVRVRYKTEGMQGPRTQGAPFGLVAKTGDWLWGTGKRCDSAGTGNPVTAFQGQNSNGWQILEGSYTSGSASFLPNFYLALENTTGGVAFIDHVWVEEDLGNGQYGPNIMYKGWMAHHLYFDQHASVGFDNVVKLAEQNGVYLRPVILEKNELIFNRMDFDGQHIPNDPRCKDQDPNNNPERCPGNKWFYGNGRNMTKARWLQQAYWRYLQARWGYSTAIHSWELLNEGDPNDSNHFKLADEFGKFMRQFAPNHHMVTTSFWHSYPAKTFLANENFPNIDFGDVHWYVKEEDGVFEDTALSSYDMSMRYGARQADGAGKPVIRGETGFGGPTSQFNADVNGIWLHNFVWAGINSGGMIESYWYEVQHIYKKNQDGSYRFDHRPQYRTYFNFITRLPLSNGHYEDAAPQVGTDGLRVWGQKDLHNGRAHLWIQNSYHTWKRVVEGLSIPRLSGEVTLAGFKPCETYTLEWWDPYQPDRAQQILRTEGLVADGEGKLTIRVTDLESDTAIQLYPKGSPPSDPPGDPPPGPDPTNPDFDVFLPVLGR